jgi:hypothetical protein
MKSVPENLHINSSQLSKLLEELAKKEDIEKMLRRSITMKELENPIDSLRKRNPKVVGLSPHDSCDAGLEVFRMDFSKGYEPVEVGRKIVISPD